MKGHVKTINHWLRGSGRLWGGLALLLVLMPAAARAHKVMVFAWVQGDTVFTESKFSGGRYARDGRIDVYNAAGEKLLEGRTDDQGRFAFKPPRSETLRIVLMAGSGHRNEWTVYAKEFADGPTVAPSPTEPWPETAPPKPMAAAGKPAETVTLSPAALQALIEQSLDKKLAPIQQRLRQFEPGPSLSDIIGGIGYILGLVGLGAYIHSRRKSG
ncbi:MAG: hypothetical protein JJV98_21980 [Desulfosarcina sp.]|nr:hypothetical protein [Desulfobacterales bacterium]